MRDDYEREETPAELALTVITKLKGWYVKNLFMFRFLLFYLVISEKRLSIKVAAVHSKLLGANYAASNNTKIYFAKGAACLAIIFLKNKAVTK